MGIFKAFHGGGPAVRRGVAGIFFMYKCAGAKAAKGGTLDEVLAAAQKAKDNTRTVGFALTPCIIPEVGHPNFTLGENEMAMGMGMAADSDQRLQAAVTFELSHNENNGHVFLPRNKLIAATAQLLDGQADLVEQALDSLIESGAVRRTIQGALRDADAAVDIGGAQQRIPDNMDDIRQLQELEWLYGADAEVQIERNVQLLLARMRTTEDKDARRTMLEHFLNEDFHFGSIDTDEVLLHLEGHTDELAALLGGKLACTRPLVDRELLPYKLQVGQSGVMIKPRLYIGFGISGAVNHVTGVDAETFIAVNSDPNAAIFNYCDYGIVADMDEVCDAMIARLKSR